MKSVSDMALPPGYTRSPDADSLTVYTPNGKVLYRYGPGFVVEVVQDDAWNHYFDISERIAELDGLLGRGESHATIVSELCDRFGIEGEEREGYAFRCLMATVALDVELAEPCPEVNPESGWIGGTE